LSKYLVYIAFYRKELSWIG